MVLASLRTSLVKLYEKTGELRHLCLARKELLLHLESLLLTFGEDTDLQDVPGIKRRLRQINQKIAAHPPRLDEEGCDGSARARSSGPSLRGRGSSRRRRARRPGTAVGRRASSAP
jgi:hypothetical protein